MTDIDVKAIRAALKLTQAALAIELGVDVMTVRRWEWKKARPSQLARRQLERLQREIK
jgi:DNA-binding transcriptional regulator YiaG